MKITTDLHVHTHISACAKKSATAEGYAQQRKKYGLTTIGFADHTWDEKIACPYQWYVPQNVARLLEKYNEYKSLSDNSLRVLVGCETEYDYAHRDIALTPESASRLDFVLVPNSHTHITMPRELYDNKSKHAAFMLDAWYDIINSKCAQYITAIAHPFYAVCCPYNNREVMRCISDSQYKDCFSAAKEKGIAIEINSSCFGEKDISAIFNDEESLRMYEIAKQCGCSFVFGTDSHDLCDMSSTINSYVFAAALELSSENVLKI